MLTRRHDALATPPGRPAPSVSQRIVFLVLPALQLRPTRSQSAERLPPYFRVGFLSASERVGSLAVRILQPTERKQGGHGFGLPCRFGGGVSHHGEAPLTFWSRSESVFRVRGEEHDLGALWLELFTAVRSNYGGYAAEEEYEESTDPE